MLHIDQGICLVVMVAILWAAREKSNVRAMYGFMAAMICTLFNMYYIGCCLSCIMLHRYNDERGDQNEKLNYAFYPVMLLILGIVGKFIG
jgi:amino acid permease